MRRILTLGCLLFLSIAATPAAAADDRAALPSSFRVEVTGHGRPMILIPGLASSGDTWKTTVARYQATYTCHVLTLAGFAGNPAIDQPLMATVRRELADYIRDQRLDKPVIVGHSLGGTLALALASDHPDLVGPLVIVDSLPFLAGAQFGAKTADEAAPSAAATRAYLSAMSRPQYEAYVKTGAVTRFMVTSDADHDVVKGWSLASDPKTVGNAMADLYVLDLRAGMSRVESPALVLGTWAGISAQVKSGGGALSREAVVAQFEQQFAGLRRMHFALAESARHFVMFDDPRWFFAEIDAFLANPSSVVLDRGFAAKGASR